jgi:hypothetical protein
MTPKTPPRASGKIKGEIKIKGPSPKRKITANL